MDHGPAVFADLRSSYVIRDKQVIALFGVENLFVVTTDDAVLVAKRDDAYVCAGWCRSLRTWLPR